MRECPRVAVGISHFKGLCRAGAGTESWTKPGTGSETEPELGAEAGSETEPEARSGTESGTKSVAEPEPGAEGTVSRISPCRLCRGV